MEEHENDSQYRDHELLSTHAARLKNEKNLLDRNRNRRREGPVHLETQCKRKICARRIATRVRRLLAIRARTNAQGWRLSAWRPRPPAIHISLPASSRFQ